MEHVFSTKAPPYSALLEIEKTILLFPVPKHLRSPEQAPNTSSSWSSDPVCALQQYCTLCVRQSSSRSVTILNHPLMTEETSDRSSLHTSELLRSGYSRGLRQSIQAQVWPFGQGHVPQRVSPNIWSSESIFCLSFLRARLVFLVRDILRLCMHFIKQFRYMT